MKNLLLFIFLLSSVHVFSQNQPPAEITQHAIKKIPVTGADYGDIYYLEHLPADYETSDKTYPVIIFLHGASEQSDDTTAQNINLVATWGPPSYIEAGNDMTFTANGVTESFIVISPQLQRGSTDGWEADYLHDVVQHVMATYRVDPDRIGMTGLSMGGGYIWNYAVQHPNILAAIAPVSSGWPYNPYMIRRVIADHLAAWAFHGEDDTVIPLEVPQEWQDSLVALGADPAPLIKVYPNVGHNVWNRAYSVDKTYQDPNLYEWFLTQRRYDTPFAPNEPPVAQAGADTTVQLPFEAVQLNGSASTDPEGSTLYYVWSQVGGPSRATVAGKDSSILTVSSLDEGTYTFQLSVLDYERAEAVDTVQVTVADGVITGLEDTLSAPGLLTYPNPAHQRMTVRFNDPVAGEGEGTLLLTDLSGKVVRRWHPPFHRTDGLLQIETESIPTGVYLLQLRADRSFTTKVSIQH